MSAAERLRTLGITLPEVVPPAAADARSAFGVAQIPLGSCVEIELVAQVTPLAE